LHVIGFVGAGKSTFIRQYLNEYPAFDIQTIYKEFNFTPAELKDSSANYRQFEDSLRYSLETFFKEARLNVCPMVVVESSGLNQALNTIITNNTVYTLWIDLGSELPYDEVFLEEHPYAKDLNVILQEHKDKGELSIDNTFNVKTCAFDHPLSPELQEFIQIRPKTKKISSPTNKKNPIRPPTSKDQQDLFICSQCGAAFSKIAYLETHLKRSPQCISKSSK
jgi:predicted kinase